MTIEDYVYGDVDDVWEDDVTVGIDGISEDVDKDDLEEECEWERDVYGNKFWKQKGFLPVKGCVTRRK